MAVTGYLGLPAEMANIHLRPPTRSADRASANSLETRGCTGYSLYPMLVYTVALPLAQHALVTAHHRDLCAYNKRCILNPF